MNNSLEYFIFEEVFLQGNRLLKVSNGDLTHMHESANIKLIYPMNGLINP